MTYDGNSIIGHLRRTLGGDALADAPDDTLLEQFIAQRDEAAFATLLRRHGPMVWGVCQRLAGGRQDAEDSFQATFLVLTRKAGSIGRRKLLANWLFGVARRAALNARAMRARRARHEQSYAEPPDTAGPPPRLWDDAGVVLDKELARLPEKYRLPLLLCGLEGMTHDEAGKHLGWPTGTVAGRLSRGRELLRGRLTRCGITAPAAALAAFLAPEAAPAAVPPELATASLRSAVALLVAGRQASALVSSAVAALAGGVLRKMLVSRMLTAAAILGALATTLGGAAAAWQMTHAQEPAVVLPNLSGSAPPAARTASSRFRLPADPGAVVLRMDRFVDSSKAPGTSLRIYADGRVIVEVPEGLLSLSAVDLTQHARETANTKYERPKIKVVEGKLPLFEVEGLVRFALEEQDFFAFEPAAVKTAIAQKHHKDSTVTDNTDATTVSFQVQTADRNHEVKWSRLSKSLWDFPDTERLWQLRAVEQRLARVYYILRAGGLERIQSVATKMDELLKVYYRSSPQTPRLTAADFSRLGLAEDGTTLRFVFSHDEPHEFKALFEAALDVPDEDEPTLAYVIPVQKRPRLGNK
jgi:RNA polymerase sigma factor (sigma-70 family)